MLKLANQVLDVHDDITKAGMKKLAQIAPDVVVMSASERAALPDRSFALSVITKKAAKLNKFPIADKDSTWLSNQYFDMTCHRLTKAAQVIAASNIKAACERHGIDPLPAVSGLAKEATSNVYYEEDGKLQAKTPVVQVDFTKFASVNKICDSYTEAQYAFATPVHIVKACEYFEKHASKMNPEQRHKYAAAIQRRANELGMPVQKGEVGKYASDHLSPMIDAHISMRRGLLEGRDAELGTLSKLASAKKQLGPSQFARALHAFDKKAGLNKYYGGHLLDPFLASFASEPDPHAGYMFKGANSQMAANQIEQLAHAKYDDVKNYFGSSIADEFKKNPVPIFDSLPNDSKEILAGIANGTL